MTTPLRERRALLTVGMAGGLALLAPHLAAAGQQSDVTAANIKVVNDFCAAFASRDLNQPLAFLASDVVYRVTETTPPVTGHDGVKSRLQSFMDSSSRVEFEVLDTYAKGPMVVNHRIDTFTSTTRPLVWEGVGIFFIKDGKIREWHDYTIRISR